LERHFGLV